MHVLRVYHAGRDSSHRERDRALVRAGVQLTLLVPAQWPGPDQLHDEPFEIATLPVRRPGDVNRHSYAEPRALRRLIECVRPDVLDLHEEPFSRVTRQLLGAAPAELPTVAYSAQNIDKRWPPPFHQWERAALARLAGAYPCSRQAAAVLRRHGCTGAIWVLPLGVDREVFRPAAVADAGLGGTADAARDGTITLGFVGRLVPEKGGLDALEVLARVRAIRPARLVIVGEGPAAGQLRRRAGELGVAAAVAVHPWCDPAELAEHYRRMDVLLVPSHATRTWVEQFGRVVIEARSCGTPVVAYASGALPEVLDDPAALVDEGDVAGMAAAVLRLVDAGPERRHTPGPGAMDWDEVARGQLGLYRQALGTVGGEGTVETPAAIRPAEPDPPARVPGGGRPFALPLLRQDTVLSRSLARLLDRFGSDWQRGQH